MKTKDALSYLKPGENFGGLIGSRYESNNMHSVRGGLYGKANALPIDYLIYAKRASFGDITLADGGTDDYKKVDNDETVDTVYLNLGWNISDEQRLSFSVFDFEEELTTVWQTLYHYESDTPIYGKLKQTDYVADYSYESVANSLLNLNMKLYVSNASYDRGFLSTTSGDQVDYENKDRRWGLDIKNVAEFETGSISHMLLTGLDYKNRKEDAIYVKNGATSDFGSMPNQYNDWGLYVQDIMSIQRLEVTLGGRFDLFDRSLDRTNSTDYKDHRFSPRIATAYELFNGLHLLLGYSESFRAPTPHETSSKGALNPHYYYLENPDLKAETAKEFEGGFSYLSSNLLTEHDALYIKATVFDGKIENMITLEKLPELGNPPESTMYAQYQNIKNARRKGYEISAKYLIDEFLLQSSYEHLDIYDEETKQNASQGFADKLNVTTTYTNDILGLELKVGVDHWFKPKQNPKTIVSRGKTYTYVDQEFTQVNFAGKWNMGNAGLGIDYLDDVTVKFGVKNIFDKKYINARFTNGTSRVG
ncbi:MAG TPA: TonB-dependent receptor, partial [Vibrio sp.]|nr:TonB-dependent receptor [Vibrio sp.]